SPKFRGDPMQNIITGNVVLYGAIAGEAYFRGVAGERFAVRNSGAHAVVEGVGDHCCEYMTGGTIIVLGAAGRNFAAGMSGGIAYVYDEDGSFPAYCNTAMVQLDPLLTEAEQDAKLARDLWHMGEADEVIVKRYIDNHARLTGSARAQQILADWSAARAKFVKVFPNEYRRALGELAAKGKKIAA
ncbi:MAG: glutamate synthase subunit alpha, partial [Betaproteobacteria bacterium]|nr:glutamate synthase subunit alpha [Betaproteobacteria bacterium]